MCCQHPPVAGAPEMLCGPSQSISRSLKEFTLSNLSVDLKKDATVQEFNHQSLV